MHRSMHNLILDRVKTAANLRGDRQPMLMLTSSHSAWPSSKRPRWPRTGLGATLFSPRQRCIHLIELLALTPKSFAAERADAPPSTYRTRRTRRSSEYAKDIAVPRITAHSETRSSRQFQESLTDSIHS